MRSIIAFARRRSLMGAAGALLFLTAGCGQTPPADPSASAKPPAESAPAPGEKAAESAVSVVAPDALAGLMEAARGKVLVVNYWATWCPPCVHELPEFAAFYKAMDSANVAFISVSTDHPSTVADTVAPFVKERALPFPVQVFDGMPDDLSAAVDVGDWTSAVPATFVYDREGKLTRFWNEEVTRSQVEEAVAAALAGGA